MRKKISFIKYEKNQKNKQNGYYKKFLGKWLQEAIIQFDQISTQAILILGPSGVGKSTFIHYLFGNKLKAFKYAGLKWDVVSCQNQEIKKIEISHNIQSKTIFPNHCIIETMGKKYTVFDIPGFFDNRGPEFSIINHMFNYMLCKKIQNIKFIIVAQYSELISQRGKNIIFSFDQFLKIFKFDERFSLDTLVKSISFVLTKSPKQIDRADVDSMINQIKQFAYKENKINISLMLNHVKSNVFFMRMPSSENDFLQISFSQKKKIMTNGCPCQFNQNNVNYNPNKNNQIQLEVFKTTTFQIQKALECVIKAINELIFETQKPNKFWKQWERFLDQVVVIKRQIIEFQCPKMNKKQEELTKISLIKIVTDIIQKVSQEYENKQNAQFFYLYVQHLLQTIYLYTIKTQQQIKIWKRFIHVFKRLIEQIKFYEHLGQQNFDYVGQELKIKHCIKIQKVKEIHKNFKIQADKNSIEYYEQVSKLLYKTQYIDDQDMIQKYISLFSILGDLYEKNNENQSLTNYLKAFWFILKNKNKIENNKVWNLIQKIANALEKQNKLFDAIIFYKSNMNITKCTKIYESLIQKVGGKQLISAYVQFCEDFGLKQNAIKNYYVLASMTFSEYQRNEILHKIIALYDNKSDNQCKGVKQTIQLKNKDYKQQLAKCEQILMERQKSFLQIINNLQKKKINNE